jgi:hypothetical protein
VRHLATVALTTAALAVTVALAGCGGRLRASSFFDLHVKNNTRPTVTLVNPRIPGDTQRFYNGEGVYWSGWRNDKPGVALLRVMIGGKTLGCLKVHYREGQEHAVVLVSAATPCSS